MPASIDRRFIPESNLAVESGTRSPDYDLLLEPIRDRLLRLCDLCCDRVFARPTTVDAHFHPPVTILKPICGLDSDAYENLASFCRQEYLTYQIIFGVQDFSDPSIEVVRQIIHDFPEVDIQLVISDRVIGTNLKVSNLANAAVEAKYDILLLADSDIQVQPDYLQQVVQPLKDAVVGVVTCMYRSQTQGWVSAFEAIGISTEFLPSVLVARKLEGMAFAMGPRSPFASRCWMRSADFQPSPATWEMTLS